MKVFYICDEGLPIEMDTGSSSDATKSFDKVANMQSAIKFLVRSKDVKACKVKDIEVYKLGVTQETYEQETPLSPEDKIPIGSSKKDAVFVHVPREKQKLRPEERIIRIRPTPQPKVMARPQIEKLVMNPKKKKPKPKKPAKPKEVEVTVRCADGKEFKAIIDPKHTIADLKNQFGYDSGVPSAQQTLAKDGNELEDSKTAADSGIKHGDVIDLDSKPITVKVRAPNGKTIPVTMKLSDTTEFIKEKVAPESGIEVHRQILRYIGNELPDSQTAKDSGLKEGSYIDLEPRTIKIQVKTPDGKMIPVEMLPTDKILFIKETVAPESGIEVAKQLLKYNEKELPSEQSAIVAGLKDGKF